MGRGRAPCCDKNTVITGPWSPAEDHKLISFIQKHGHDNWRAVPKQAGLLRCGKSCRLRWVNYLRPTVKRGNYTKEEEDTIIQLHQILGNKWSKIASHLPGRTDNEIKNVWNTHLKKRLVNRAVEEVSKEISVVTSSSSSSTTVESHSKCQKPEIESQIKLLARDESKLKTDGTGLTEMTEAQGNQATNQATTVNGCEFDPIPQHSGQTLDASDNYQHENITIWEDASLLESMLNEVDDLNWPLPPAKTQNGSTGNNSCELHMYDDFDLWNMLDIDVPASAKPDQNKANNVNNKEAPISKIGMITPYEHADENDIRYMNEYLENEAQQMEVLYEKQKQNQKDNVNNSFSAESTESQVPYMNDFLMWPQSPLYFSD